MDHDKAKYIYYSEKEAQLSLLDLPEEVFLYICSFLNMSTLVHNLSLVCKQFHCILNSDSIWKTRIRKIWPNVNYPLLDTDTILWKSSYIEIRKGRMRRIMKYDEALKRHSKILKSQVVSLLKMSDSSIFIYAVNNNLTFEEYRLISKDGCSLDLGDIYISEKANKQKHLKMICDLTSMNDTIFSCDSESSIKSWKITRTDVEMIKTYKVNTPSSQTTCLSSCSKESLFAIGTHPDGSVYVFDSRSGSKPIWNYQTDTKGVNKLAMNTKYILNIGENQTVSVWDQQAGRTFKTVTVPDTPTCMNLQHNCVYIGDNNGHLHILDPNNDFELVKSYFTGHKDRMMGVYLSQSYLITGFRTGLIKIMSATDPPLDIVSFHSKVKKINNMDYIPDAFAISSDDNTELIIPLYDNAFKFSNDLDDNRFHNTFSMFFSLITEARTKKFRPEVCFEFERRRGIWTCINGLLHYDDFSRTRGIHSMRYNNLVGCMHPEYD